MARSRNRPWFDAAEADRVVAFFEKVLKHTEGRWAGRPFILEPWQKDEIIRPLFGWMRWDAQLNQWVRKYSKALCLLPRGNGKSELAAGIELYMLSADGEYGAEVYGGAEDRDQASIVFRVAAEMVRLSPVLSKRLKVIDSRKRIIDPSTNSFYQVLPRDRMGTGSQGFKPHGYVIDEVHVQKTKDFMDAMKRGMGKRTQPLAFLISTETDDDSSAAAEEFDYALKVHNGEIDDPSYFTFIKKAPKQAEQDPFNEDYWHESNPALGRFLLMETLRQEAREAKEKPSELAKFLQYRLNIRTKAGVAWMPIDRWDATSGMVDPEKLKGRQCYAGLHLAASTDIAALVLDFPDDQGGHDILCRFWLPQMRLDDLNRRTDNKASVWAKEQWHGVKGLQITPGDMIDYQAIHTQVEKDADDFDLQEVVYHRWGATQLAQEIQDAGLEIVQGSTGMAGMSPPTKELERLVYEKQYRHGGHPVLRWMMTNAVIKKDSDDNIKIDPKLSRDSVVGLIAAVFALDWSLRNEGQEQETLSISWL